MIDFFEPRVSGDTVDFWKGNREHKLRFQRCTKCGRIRWPAAFLCPDCLSSQWEAVTLTPRGTLYSFVVMHRAFHPSLAEKVPYIIAEVDLDEGVRMVTNLVDADPAQLKCGGVVELTWCDSQGYSRPVAHWKGEP